MPITTFQGLRGNSAANIASTIGSNEAIIGNAKDKLAELGRALLRDDDSGRVRDGVLRLRSHKGRQDASLDLVGAKRWGGLFGKAHSTARLATGKAMQTLLAKAGASSAVLAEFKNECDKAGKKGVSAEVMLRFIGRAQQQVQSEHSLEGLYQKIGLTLKSVNANPIGVGAHGAVGKASYAGENMVLKEFEAPKNLKLAGPDGKFDRAQLNGAATYLKGVPGFVAPRLYIVAEQLNDAQGDDTRYHAVPADKRFREWALEQPSEATERLQIVATVMPEACGPSMDNIMNDTAHRVPSSQWQKALHNGLHTLSQLHAHAAVHGDIKPNNFCMDVKTGQLDLIDSDGLNKFSKRADARAGEDVNQVTQAYNLPRGSKADLRKKRGLEHDLFGLGMSVLVASLENRGEAQVVKDLLNDVRDKSSGVAIYQATVNRNYSTALVRQDLSSEMDGRLAGIRLTAAEQEALDLVKCTLAQPGMTYTRFDANAPDKHPFHDWYARGTP